MIVSVRSRSCAIVHLAKLAYARPCVVQHETNPGEYCRHDAIAARRLELENAGHYCANPRTDCAANHDARAVQTRLDGLLAEAKPRSRLARAQAFDVAQHEHRAVRFWKGIDRV